LYVGTPQIIGKESLNINGALSRCLLHYVNKVNYVSLFTMELEKLLVNGKITAFCQTNLSQALNQSLQKNSNEFRKTVGLTCFQIQLNLSTADTVGQKKVAVVERFKPESMYGLSAQKNGRCRELAVSGGSTVPQL